MRSLSLSALVVSVILIPLSVGVAVTDHNRHRADLERQLSGEAEQHAGALDAYFLRSRSAVLLTAHDPAFGEYFAGSEPRHQVLQEANRALGYLEELYPDSIGEACFIAAGGRELARIVRGVPAFGAQLSEDESQNVFFRPTLGLPQRDVYQAQPYISPDMKEWVISNSTLVPTTDGSKPGIVHFEVRLEAFRKLAATDEEEGYGIDVLDARTGKVVIAGDTPQIGRTILGRPDDARFRSLARVDTAMGVTELDGHVVAYRQVARDPHNANHWTVVAISAQPLGNALTDAGPAPIGMLCIALLMLGLSVASLRASRRELQTAATTDPLTGLPNRRKLAADLERRLERDADSLLMLFDLNGFKIYNDLFGHLAGDALLTRLGQALREATAPYGGAYRLGGDEFCVLARADRADEVELAALAALHDRGEGFEVTASFGTVFFPHETADATEAMRIADQRMYAQKNGGRPSAQRQSSDVLLRALAERHPDLGDHLDGVTELAVEVGRRLGITGVALDQVRHAAELHDVGKVAIPDAILSKPGPLDDDEWTFMKRHTLIGERIVAAAADLAPVARLVRSSHERWDGTGYPDGLAGEDIPLGARIVAVCDTFDAIVSDRAYRAGSTPEAALAELRRCAGTQFDPAIVDAFDAVVSARLERVNAT